MSLFTDASRVTAIGATSPFTRKASYRMVGSVMGAIFIVVLSAAFPQDRAPFLLGLALWGGACTLIATLLRNFASYAAALAGYTAAIIAADELGAVGGTNGQVFLLAVWRVTGIWIGTNPVDGARGQHALNSVGYNPLLRAALIRMDEWVNDEKDPPPSRYPRLADGTAVAPNQLKSLFTAIPGIGFPAHLPPAVRLDFGPDSARGLATILPPTRRAIPAARSASL
jgi:hypothetical protein